MFVLERLVKGLTSVSEPSASETRISYADIIKQISRLNSESINSDSIHRDVSFISSY